MTRPNPALLPWHRQFWPWFVIALIGSAVLASLITLWIAVRAAPQLVNGAGAMTVQVYVNADRNRVRLDPVTAFDFAPWPTTLNISVISHDGLSTQNTVAQLNGAHYDFLINPPAPGSYDVVMRSNDYSVNMQGTWHYPAPVWKLWTDE